MMSPGRFSILIIAITTGILWPTPRVHGQAKRRHPQTSSATQRHALTPREIAAKVSRSLVLIVTQDKDGRPLSSGSGFFYNIRAAHDPRLPPGVEFDPEEIVTSLHVFKRASLGYVKLLGEGVSYKIDQIVAIDIQHDLCVFKASGASAQPLALAVGPRPSVGDDVYVAGNPRGLESTFSKGIVSAIRSDRGLIQIDAAISPGSSGGPVVNTRAEVVGIAASSLVEGQNLNFAIDANYLGALPRDWKAPVFVAAALALKDREIEELKGSVRSVTTKTVSYNYDQVNDRYVEGRVLSIRTDAYDYDGSIIELSLYIDAELQTRIRLEYNEKGFNIRSSVSGKFIVGGERTDTHSESDSIDSKINKFNMYEYDHSLVSEGESTDLSTGEKRAYKTVRSFDNNGWKTEETKYWEGKLGLVDRYKYEADAHGNWIKRYTTTYNSRFPEIGFTPTDMVYREIRYYDGR